MDDIDFLRGIEGKAQNDKDLLDGAEHLIRLRHQVGQSRQYDDLELEKRAGELAESLATPSTHCKNCKKIKTACMCGDMGGGEKMAGIKEVVEGAKSGLKYQTMGAAAGLRGLKIPGARSRSAGMLAGMAAPAAVVGGAAYLAGKHNQEKTASPLEEVLVNARIKTATSRQEPSSKDDFGNYLSIKLAEAREKSAASIVERLKDINPGLVATTGAGALAGGIGTYLSSRAQENGKSKSEEELEGKVESQKGKSEDGLLNKLRHRNTELEHGYAKAFRDHPVKASILGTITGGIGGYGIGRLAGGVAKMRGGK